MWQKRQVFFFVLEWIDGKNFCMETTINEEFGGKRALCILRKIELCQKCSKFCMQFCLGVLTMFCMFFP